MYQDIIKKRVCKEDSEDQKTLSKIFGEAKHRLGYLVIKVSNLLTI